MIDKLYHYKAVVNDVKDGDTIGVTIDLGFKTRVDAIVRLDSIDTPEVFSPRNSDEKELGLKAKMLLEEILAQNNNEVIIHTKKDSKDKYGRYLAEIRIPKQLSIDFAKHIFASYSVPELVSKSYATHETIHETLSVNSMLCSLGYNKKHLLEAGLI